jgi:hypothetical protein
MQNQGIVKEMTNRMNSGYVDLLYKVTNDQNIKNIRNFNACFPFSAMLFPNR